MRRIIATRVWRAIARLTSPPGKPGVLIPGPGLARAPRPSPPRRYETGGTRSAACWSAGAAIRTVPRWGRSLACASGPACRCGRPNSMNASRYRMDDVGPEHAGRRYLVLGEVARTVEALEVARHSGRAHPGPHVHRRQHAGTRRRMRPSCPTFPCFPSGLACSATWRRCLACLAVACGLRTRDGRRRGSTARMAELPSWSSRRSPARRRRPMHSPTKWALRPRASCWAAVRAEVRPSSPPPRSWKRAGCLLPGSGR